MCPDAETDENAAGLARDCNPGKVDGNRQLEVHQGTKPATKPGALIRKSTEPTIGAILLVTCSCQQMSRLWAMGMSTPDSGYRNSSGITFTRNASGLRTDGRPHFISKRETAYGHHGLTARDRRAVYGRW